MEIALAVTVIILTALLYQEKKEKEHLVRQLDKILSKELNIAEDKPNGEKKKIDNMIKTNMEKRQRIKYSGTDKEE